MALRRIYASGDEVTSAVCAQSSVHAGREKSEEHRQRGGPQVRVWPAPPGIRT